MKDQLKIVQSLFLSGHHKKCIGKCEELLSSSPEPGVYGCYLTFYIGLSYEALARNTSVNSPLRQKHLSQAERAYLAAEADLPPPATTRSTSPWTDEEDEGHRTPTYPVAPESHRASYVSRDSWVSSVFTSTSTIDDYYLLDQFPVPKISNEDLKKFTPAPLQFSSSPASPRMHSPYEYEDILTPLSVQFDENARSTAASSPATSQFSPLVSEGYLREQASRLGTEPYSPTASAHFHTLRFNNHLHDFTQMLQMHVANVRGLQHPTSIKSFRLSKVPASAEMKRLSTYSDPTSRKAKVAELLDKAWRRERFQPDRYVELCEQALAEI